MRLLASAGFRAGLLAVLAAFAAGPCFAQNAPTRDCRQAHLPVERETCRSDSLFQLRREVESLHESLTSRLTGQARTHLWDDQGRWVDRAKACEGDLQIAACLERAHQQRIRHLRFLSEEAYPFISEHALVRHARAKHVVWSIDAAYPQFDSPVADFSALNRQLAAWARAEAKDLEIIAADLPAGTPLELMVLQDFELDRPTANTINIIFHRYAYKGGAHGIASTYALLVDLRSGHALDVGDVFGPGGAWQADLLPEVAAGLRKAFDERQCPQTPDSQSLEEVLKAGHRYAFRRDHVDVIFNPYEIGPYVCGGFRIEIPYRLLQAHIRPDGPLAGLR